MEQESSSAKLLMPQSSAVSYLDLRGLNEEEKERIRKVVERDQEFKSQEGLNYVNSGFARNMEGQLSKFTNLVKGWQFRWFVLDAEAGTLTYFLGKEKLRNRGCLLLTNGVVSPSDEDSMSFTVNACNGDIYKLRAADAKERQHWINLMRAVAEFHAQTSINPVQHPPSPAGEKLMSQLRRSATLSVGSPSHSAANKPSIQKSASLNYHDQFPRTRTAVNGPVAPNPIEEELKDIKDALTSVNEFHSSTIDALEDDHENADVSSLDEQVLLLKATSQATVNILHKCYNILHKQSGDIQRSAVPSGLPPGASIEWLEPKDGTHIKGSPLTSSQGSIESAVEEDVIDIDFTHIKQYAEHEVQDKEVYTDSQLEDMESHKSVILHLLSQLKLGMDLTRVVLPTFVLEKRSLLEMYADFLGHADLFVSIPDHETPEERMLAVLIFYLTSFHVGRKSAVAKKPYNPIIGERFHCSMLPKVSSSHVNGHNSHNGLNGNVNGSTHSISGTDETDRVYFVAEQVSHHPPISAFYAECPTKQISMNSHIWTKSKFYGMSIGVINVGEGVISLPKQNEDYIFTFPNAYCRSILTVPWIELGGKTCIQCPQTGYSCVITFHTKPFYGGKQNRLTCELRKPGSGEVGGDIVCQGEGTWDGVIELNFTDSSREMKVIDVTSLEIKKKHVRPRETQADNESRKLWSNVTDALLSSNLEDATNEKHKLEEKQRAEAKERAAECTEWKPRLFQKHSDAWVFNPAFAMIPRRRKLRSTSSDR